MLIFQKRMGTIALKPQQIIFVLSRSFMCESIKIVSFKHKFQRCGAVWVGSVISMYIFHGDNGKWWFYKFSPRNRTSLEFSSILRNPQAPVPTKKESPMPASRGRSRTKRPTSNSGRSPSKPKLPKKVAKKHRSIYDVRLSG
jgi:hypothetical protein